MSVCHLHALRCLKLKQSHTRKLRAPVVCRCILRCNYAPQKSTLVKARVRRGRHSGSFVASGRPKSGRAQITLDSSGMQRSVASSELSSEAEHLTERSSQNTSARVQAVDLIGGAEKSLTARGRGGDLPSIYSCVALQHGTTGEIQTSAGKGYCRMRHRIMSYCSQ